MEVLQIWVRSLERKQEIRRRIRELRRELSLSEWKNKTHSITKQILSQKEFADADAIYCYVDFDREAGTRGIIEEAWRMGKRVYVPRVQKDTMDFYRITSYTELETGTFGVLEPGLTGHELPADGQSGLMIVPGVAFDRECNRIGYGKGYYDRYLASHTGLHTIAAAFDLQIVDAVEAEKTDIRPEILITETTCYYAGEQQGIKQKKQSKTREMIK